MSLYNESICTPYEKGAAYTYKLIVTRKKSIRGSYAQRCSHTLYSRLKMFNKK
ncbi:hypothetical protein DESC_190065 [Desulfosarcina cetonica]|nr:hypothetical protein DESC_190065 [Desulfosarcina cetonica]